MSQFTFAVSHYAALGALALIAFHAGRTLTSRLTYHSVLEEIAFSTSLGLAAIAYVVMAVGLIDLLHVSVVAAGLIVLAVACFPAWIVTGRRLTAAVSSVTRPGRIRFVWMLVGIVALVVVLKPVLQLPLYPPTAFDSTMYHLAAAKTYVHEHGLVLTPDLRYPVFPQTPHMLFTLALLIYDDVLAQLVQFLALALMVCALLAIAARHLSARAGWLAAALLASSPLVLWVSSSAYIDATAMLFVTVMSSAFWNWFRTRERRWLIVAGVLGGIAVTVKLPAAFFLALFGLVALAAGPRKYARDVLLFALAGIVVASPWLVRSAYYTSNPVFPVMREAFGSVFGYGVLGAEDYRHLFEDFSSYGFGRSVGALLMLPWNLATSPGKFAGPAPLAVSLFIVLPFLAVGLFHSRSVRALTLVSAAFTLFWFYTGQELRYLLPALPLVCLAVGASLDLVGARRLSSAAFAVLAGLLFYPGWHYANRVVSRSGSVPTTEAQRDGYLKRHLPSYEAYALLRAQGKRDYTAYAIQDENLKYYTDGRQLGDYFGPARYDLIWGKLSDADALFEALKALGVDYFIVNHRRARVPLVMDAAFSRRFRVLLEGPDVSLFDLTDQPIQRHGGQELLVNPGFETLIDGRPAGWAIAGNPIVDGSGVNSATGSVAVRCVGSTNVLFQVIDVKPRQSYLLSFSAKGIADGQTARRQVNWIDDQKRFLTTSLDVLRVTGDWRRYEMWATAPDLARQAVVYASCEGAGSSWFDDISFTEIGFERGPAAVPRQGPSGTIVPST